VAPGWSRLLCVFEDRFQRPCALRPRAGLLLWTAFVLAACACRGRAPRATQVDAATAIRKAPPATLAEKAALLLVDRKGVAQIVCLPGPVDPRPIFPRAKLLQVMDATWWNGGVALAARVSAAAQDSHVLLSEGRVPRSLGKGVRSARFSPSGDALAFQTATREAVTGGTVVDVEKSYVLDRATGEVANLGEVVDPLWEADGQHLRATRLVRTAEEIGRQTRSTSLRIRWDRRSRNATIWGRGSAQIPAQMGTATAWSEEERGGRSPSHCTVRIGRGGPWHLTIGPFCAGIADDRSVRWSPDGQWLAFARPGPVPGERRPGTFFVDVVGTEGGRYPALSALYARALPGQSAMAAAPGRIWMDWSPSGRYLAVQDAASDLRVYDFDGGTISFLGQGEQPTWSPGGDYVLILAPGPEHPRESAPTAGREESPVRKALVLPGGSRTASLSLGPVRDARWLPPAACGSSAK
jgi:dipeptidyl aminopeptidase/acylaminoacyl peptidase